MKKVAVITSTRAEFGLLYPVIKCLRKHENSEMKIDLIVTGTHLSAQYGNTINEIKKSGLRIDHEIHISTHSNTALEISENQADALVKFTEHFSYERYNGILILGDRYEMLAIAIAAGITRTPVFHMGGGDTTEGAIDEWARHSITKISYLHFVSNELSRKRVIQLGESPDRVFNYGSTSLDNILETADMTKTDALHSIGLHDCKYALCTYHPVTLESESVEIQIQSFLDAIKEFPEIEFIITKSNADLGGAKINEILDDAAQKISNIHVYTSLGMKRYLSLMKYSEFVIGNSSSGIIETPSFQVPTVNIGNRQRGRLQADSIVNCSTQKESIVQAICQVQKDEFKKLCENVRNPYAGSNSAERISEKIIETVMSDRINLMKDFYDL